MYVVRSLMLSSAIVTTFVQDPVAVCTCKGVTLLSYVHFDVVFTLPNEEESRIQAHH